MPCADSCWMPFTDKYAPKQNASLTPPRKVPHKEHSPRFPSTSKCVIGHSHTQGGRPYKGVGGIHMHRHIISQPSCTDERQGTQGNAATCRTTSSRVNIAAPANSKQPYLLRCVDDTSVVAKLERANHSSPHCQHQRKGYLLQRKYYRSLRSVK